MRSGPNTRRLRGRNSGRRNSPSRSQNFESNGPEVKVRGNAQQVVEKYLQLARDAATGGNPVMAENFFQHAEHYHRVLHANGGGNENRQGGRPEDGAHNGAAPEAGGNGAEQPSEQPAMDAGAKTDIPLGGDGADGADDPAPKAG